MPLPDLKNDDIFRSDASFVNHKLENIEEKVIEEDKEEQKEEVQQQMAKEDEEAPVEGEKREREEEMKFDQQKIDVSQPSQEILDHIHYQNMLVEDLNLASGEFKGLEQSLRELGQMGFLNYNLNKKLLIKHRNDISAVAEAIISNEISISSFV